MEAYEKLQRGDTITTLETNSIAAQLSEEAPVWFEQMSVALKSASSDGLRKGWGEMESHWPGMAEKLQQIFPEMRV